MRDLDVPASAAGERLDRFLAEPLGSRAQAQRLIDAGQVLVDGAARPKRHRAGGGERVEVDEARAASPPPERGEAPFTVAYEDEHLLVVDKPAGVVVHPARGHRAGTLVAGSRRPGGRRPGPVARGHRPPPRPRHVGPARRRATDEVHGALQAALRARRIEREYLALVEAARRRARARSTRRSAATAAHADADVHRHRRSARRRRPTSRSSATLPDACAAARAAARPGAPTRSASTWRRSATRWPATPSTRPPPGELRPRSASSCTPRGWPSTIPVTGERDRRPLAAARRPRRPRCERAERREAARPSRLSALGLKGPRPVHRR